MSEKQFFWLNRDVEELSKEELIEALMILFEAYEKQREAHYKLLQLRTLESLATPPIYKSYGGLL